MFLTKKIFKKNVFEHLVQLVETLPVGEVKMKFTGALPRLAFAYSSVFTNFLKLVVCQNYVDLVGVVYVNYTRV